MSDQPLVALATILLLGLLAQWLAWRLRVPSILLLLTFGLLAGPVSGVLDPDELLGDLLLPVVSLSVGVILFEGGLSLGLRELRQAGAVVRNLVTLGVVVTGGIGTAASLVLFDVDSSVAALIGAIVVVTGPTVIGPLLRQIRPVGAVGSVLRVEGILVDPIGALLAVLVFEGILADTLEEAAPAIGLAILETLVVGTVAGLLGAGLLVLVLKRYLVPDALHNALALGIVVAVFTGADRIQEESGLFAATVMGIALASQRITPVRHILEFSETLQILLISGLFIVLGARVETDGLSSVALGSVGLLAVLVLVARPLAVLVSTFRSRLGRRERLFLMAMAPRGIVAAAVSSIFAIRLTELGRPGADTLVPVTFLVVLGSIVIYGVAAPRVALRLGLSDPDPQGVLVVGAHRWARDIGSVLAERGVRVVMVDNDRANVVAARLAGFPSVYGSVLSDRALDEVDLGGIGRMLALTPNDEVNALAAQQFVPIFGRKNVFQLAPRAAQAGPRQAPGAHLLARILVASDVTFEALDDRFRRGGVLKATQLTEEYDFAVFQSRYGDAALPLFRLEDGSLEVFAADGALRPRPGDVLVSVIDAAALDETGPRASPAGRRRAAKAEGEPGPPGAEPKRARLRPVTRPVPTVAP